LVTVLSGISLGINAGFHTFNVKMLTGVRIERGKESPFLIIIVIYLGFEMEHLIETAAV
jgi:hypothetical protein